MNKIKYQRIDQPTFLEVDQIRLGGEDLSRKDAHSAASPIKNKSPTEGSSKPGMSQSQYFEDQIDTPPRRHSGLPLQHIFLDCNSPVDDGRGPGTVTTRESSLEDMLSASPATIPVLYQKPMHKDWNRTIRGWRGRTARGGRVSRGSRETRSRVSKDDPYQHNLKVLETSELQNSSKVNTASWEVLETQTVVNGNNLPHHSLKALDVSKLQDSQEDHI
ncbi:uncharacterized protein Bfra_005230 [Botrytis fragariae]|uniref:Uncharacterized protein n=1 Tax=Botrytis fragariae TaxID=1964551 RepID=A0A8H6EIS8_9HELO|nr:uncharacterized protein Bfra_005230 [Botrytis fragariae]KAF5873766.1 hypothetical protein Bfra_005230 [Botrytis fragariae]